MAKLAILGIIAIILIGLGTFSVFATGMGPSFIEDNFMHGGRGGCYRNNENDRVGSGNECYRSGEIECGGAHSDECEEYCEENGTAQKDCPRGYDDCPNSGACW